MANRFLPEGSLVYTSENQAQCNSLEALRHAMNAELILEGQTSLCTATHDLIVSVGPFTGRIAREEVALGIREGTTREIAILSRVGRPLCFTVTDIDTSGAAPMLTLSRRRAQELTLEHLLTLPQGSILPAVVTHMEQFGAFVDIGCGFVSMIGIENISVSRISHPSRRFNLGQKLFIVITGLDHRARRVLISHKELLGTWHEAVAHFSAGMTVTGYVRGIKNYGVFVELAPNLTGLADCSMPLREDERVSVYIKSILPERMKIKLLVIQRLGDGYPPEPLSYTKTSGQLSTWCYSPQPYRSDVPLSTESPLCF